MVCQEKETQTQHKVLVEFRAVNIEPMAKIEANLITMIYKFVKSGTGVAIVEPIAAKSMEVVLIITQCGNKKGYAY